MEVSLVGAIAAGVVCGVLFIITVSIICYLIYRCQLYHDEKSSQHAPLMNGHISNGGIPTVAALVPVPAPSPTRQLYQFPTMPVRHMSTYRPRYIEERHPTGIGKQEGQGRSQTYSGAATKGPVFYDVRQHGGYRAYREPVWAQRSQEEAEATMMLGDESPKSERHFVLEENNNDSLKIRASLKRETSVKSQTEHVVERHSFRTTDIRTPSPDENRRSYLSASEAENPSPVAEVANEGSGDKLSVTVETTNQNEDSLLRESRRQRRRDEGTIQEPPSQQTSSFRQIDSTSQEPIMAVYIPETIPESIPDESSEHVQRFFINDDLYTVSARVPDRNTNLDDKVSDSHGLRVIGRPVKQPDEENDGKSSRPNSEALISASNLDFDVIGKSSKRDSHQVDYRVIKSKRRPSWLQNAGNWFSKKMNK